MAARSIGSATISFGLVSVPVNLFSSSESSASVSFNMLHTSCGSRLKQQYICSKEGTVVEKDEVGKGYEFSKGQYVRFSAEEIKALVHGGKCRILQQDLASILSCGYASVTKV